MLIKANISLSLQKYTAQGAVWFGTILIAHSDTVLSYLHTRLISTKTDILNQNNGTFLNIELEKPTQ